MQSGVLFLAIGSGQFHARVAKLFLSSIHNKLFTHILCMLIQCSSYIISLFFAHAVDIPSTITLAVVSGSAGMVHLRMLTYGLFPNLVLHTPIKFPISLCWQPVSN